MTTKHHARGIGSRIRRYRQEQGLSLSQLAKKAGISKGYLWSLEHEDDTQSRPSANTLYAVADALGVLMSDLYGRTLEHDAQNTEIPDSLRDFAESNNLPDADVRMLASVQFRGEQPTTSQRWAYIYNAIRHSQSMDHE